MSQSSDTVLHETRTTWLWMVLPLFFLGGCMFGGMAVAFPLIMQPSDATGFASDTRFLKIIGIGMPVLGVFLVLFVNKIILYLDPMRNVVGIKRKALIWRSNKEYPLAEVADVRVVDFGGNKRNPKYRLALILKSGEWVLLEGGSTSDFKKRDRTAAEIRTQLAPYLQQF